MKKQFKSDVNTISIENRLNIESFRLSMNRKIVLDWDSNKNERKTKEISSRFIKNIFCL